MPVQSLEPPNLCIFPGFDASMIIIIIYNHPMYQALGLGAKLGKRRANTSECEL